MALSTQVDRRIRFPRSQRRNSVKRVIKDFFLLTLSALFYTMACPPYDWSAAAWVTLSPFLLVIRHKTFLAATLAGLTFGVLSCAGIGYWIYVTTVQYFSLSAPVGVGLTLLNYTYFAGVYFAFAAGVMSIVLRSPSALLRAIGIPATWVASELARTYGIAGIPWELLGYTQYRFLPLIQIADLTGVYGISFLLALSGYVVAEIFVFFLPGIASWKTGSSPSSPRLTPQLATVEAQSTNQSTIHDLPASSVGGRSAIVRFPWPAVTLFAVILLFTLLYGTLQLYALRTLSAYASRPVTIAVVQGNIPNAQRWQRTQQASNLLHYAALTQQGLINQQPDLVVWPEFAVGFYLDQDPILQAQVARFTAALNANFLVGAPRRETTDTGSRVFNSAYFFSRDGDLLSAYDKRRLIPLAEYLPPLLTWLQQQRTEGPNDFTPGMDATIFSSFFAPFGVVICYEVTYPYLVQSLVQGGAQFLVNLSNDIWGADEGAAAQHFSMTVFRAVEYRRYLVRAATAGVSGFLAPSGQWYGIIPGREGVSVDKVFPRQELTVYARYGDWFALLCGAVVFFALLRMHQQTNEPGTLL